MTKLQGKTSTGVMLAFLAFPVAGYSQSPTKVLATTPSMTTETPADKIRHELAKVVDLDKPFDGDLQTILEYFSDRCKLTFVIDSVAFKSADPPLDNVESIKVKLPKLQAATLHAILRLLLDPFGGTYIVRGELVEITTPKAVLEALGYKGQNGAEHLGTPVPLQVKNMPFNEVARTLADSTGANILIDVRAQDQAKKPISATLQQAPLRTALSVMADMVELKVVPMENILYVTTPENAAKLTKTKAKKPRPELTPPPAPMPPKQVEPPPPAKKTKS